MKLLYFSLIIFGAILLWLGQPIENMTNTIVTIVGITLVMFGVYKTSTKWVINKEQEDKNVDNEI
jgi:uncharacterized membrane protein HdeD (DUF308 family)